MALRAYAPSSTRKRAMATSTSETIQFPSFQASFFENVERVAVLAAAKQPTLNLASSSDHLVRLASRGALPHQHVLRAVTTLLATLRPPVPAHECRNCRFWLEQCRGRESNPHAP